MNISQNEISEISDFGDLSGFPVKLIRTRGGLYMASGRNGGNQDTILTAGSHPAIVRHNLMKQFPNFRPAMQKSESLEENAVVVSHRHFLPQELRKASYDIISLAKSDGSIEFQVINKDSEKVASINGNLVNSALIINNLKDLPKELTLAMSGAVVEKSIELKAKKVTIKD